MTTELRKRIFDGWLGDPQDLAKRIQREMAARINMLVVETDDVKLSVRQACVESGLNISEAQIKIMIEEYEKGLARMREKPDLEVGSEREVQDLLQDQIDAKRRS